MIRRGMTRREFVAGSAAAALSLQGRGLLAQSAAVVHAGVVRTPLGALRGEVMEGVRVFRVVPFAEPPVGKLRFKPPVRVRPWGTERNATRFAAEAMQAGDPGVAKSEDCLYLNVWTPLDAMALPVFVWIHGGGFTGGSSFAPIFDGTEFARAGVMVVTVAYRLGVLGFLEMEPLLGAEYAGSADNAVRDLICALEWVRENIAAFGGDPKRVTVGGESAGAKLTDVLMGVPEAQGLFAQMISESGGAEEGVDEGACGRCCARVWRGVGEGRGEVEDGAGGGVDCGAEEIYEGLAAALSAASGGRWTAGAAVAGGDDCCWVCAGDPAADWDQSRGKCFVYRALSADGEGGGAGECGAGAVSGGVCPISRGVSGDE